MIYKTKNDMEYEIRSIRVEDAEKMLEYLDIISGESDNLSFGAGEFGMSLEGEISYLEKLVENENQISLVAICNDEIIANLSYSGGQRPRNRHCGEFGISVRKDFWNMGIGNVLMAEMINWAKSSKYCEKINLRVREDNLNAIFLYEKFGFEKEGLLLKEMKINGEFVNFILMGRFIYK